MRTTVKYLRENQLVKYNYNGLSGLALVKGVATVEMPSIGKTYILEDISGNFPTKDYPFKSFACFEVWIDVLADSEAVFAKKA